VTQWLVYLQKAKKYVEWFFSIKAIIDGQSREDKQEALSD